MQISPLVLREFDYENSSSAVEGGEGGGSVCAKKVVLTASVQFGRRKFCLKTLALIVFRHTLYKLFASTLKRGRCTKIYPNQILEKN